MKKAILLLVAVTVIISFVFTAVAAEDQKTEDSFIISEETKKEVRSWVDDECAEVSFRRYYIRLDASFYDFDNIDDILANEWYVLGTSFKVETESEVVYLSEYVDGVGKIAPPPQ